MYDQTWIDGYFDNHKMIPLRDRGGVTERKKGKEHYSLSNRLRPLGMCNLV